jgi:amino acid transporter
MCIACSVAELVSAYPTCGGLYYTVSRLAPPKWVPSISWIVGWINLLGQVAGVASSEYGSAQLLLAAVSMGSDFTYTPSVGVTVGVMAALTVLCGLVSPPPPDCAFALLRFQRSTLLALTGWKR